MRVARLLSANRTPDSYLSGGAALHLHPNTLRHSNALDFFHDSVERVATAFEQDRILLQANGFWIEVDISQPGYLRATVSQDGEATKVEWAHDSAWRFLPTVKDETVGYLLHPVDLAINKLLALAGRDEPRDLLDAIITHRTILPFGAQCWAAPGKDPGFSPLSLLELLRRRGKYRPEDFARLDLATPVDLAALKAEWHGMLSAAEQFIASRPPGKLDACITPPGRGGSSSPEGTRRRVWFRTTASLEGFCPGCCRAQGRAFGPGRFR